jgi:hypothetical protein
MRQADDVSLDLCAADAPLFVARDVVFDDALGVGGVDVDEEVLVLLVYSPYSIHAIDGDIRTLWLSIDILGRVFGVDETGW